MRLLGLDLTLLSLENLGVPNTKTNPQLDNLHSIARRPHGLFLVTGPTGSGKTTTLNSVMRYMQRQAPDQSYYTVEDPVEIEQAGVSQIEVNEAAGLTFEAGLRNILRQDPDVVLVGEIRDEATMRLAIRAALTGHLVFSTLHTNSALGAIPRLVEMGADRTLLADSVSGVMGQRVARTVCGYCCIRERFGDLVDGRSSHIADSLMRDRYENALNRYSDLPSCPGKDDEVVLFGPGCDNCNRTGTSGRRIVSELYLFDRTARNMIAQGSPQAELAAHGPHIDYQPMWEHAMALVRSGLTSLDEMESILDVHQPVANVESWSEIKERSNA